MKVIEKISLEGKDEFIFARLQGGLYMKINKLNSRKNDFINQWEFLHIKSLKKIMDRQPWYLRLLLKFNQYSFIESLYFRLS